MRANSWTAGLVLGAAMALSWPADAKNVLRWSSQGDALTMDPYSQNEGPTTAMGQHIYDPLIRRDAKLEMIPGLAVSWKVVDPTTWEFKLRPGVKFHDGTPFTADDVVFSLNRVKGPGSDFKSYITTVTEAKKIDDLTVHIVTSQPTPLLAANLTSVAIMSKAWAEKHNVVKAQDYKAKEETHAVRNAMGSGPYVLKIREPDVRTVLEKNPNWWGWDNGKDAPDEIVYTPVKNAATRVAAILSGELDFLLDPPVQDIARLKAAPSLHLKETNQIRTIFLGMDQARSELRSSDVKGKNPFSDKRVRQAVYQAVDIEAIKGKVMRDNAIPAGMVTSPGVHGYTKAHDTRLKYDAEAAKKLLADAGYPNGFSVKLDCPNDRYVNDEGICQALVPMLGRIGIKVQLETQSKTLHFPKIQRGESDFYMLGWGVPTLDSHYVFSFLGATATQGSSSWNFTGYSNKRLDQLSEAMDQELDKAKRDAMIAEAWTLMNGDVPYVPLHHQVIAWAMSKKIDMPIIANDSPQLWLARFK